MNRTLDERNFRDHSLFLDFLVSLESESDELDDYTEVEMFELFMEYLNE